MKKLKFVILSFGERKKKSLNSLVTDEIPNTARLKSNPAVQEPRVNESCQARYQGSWLLGVKKSNLTLCLYNKYRPKIGRRAKGARNHARYNIENLQQS